MSTNTYMSVHMNISYSLMLRFMTTASKGMYSIVIDTNKSVHVPLVGESLDSVLQFIVSSNNGNGSRQATYRGRSSGVLS